MLADYTRQEELRNVLRDIFSQQQGLMVQLAQPLSREECSKLLTEYNALTLRSLYIEEVLDGYEEEKEEAAS